MGFGDTGNLTRTRPPAGVRPAGRRVRPRVQRADHRDRRGRHRPGSGGARRVHRRRSRDTKGVAAATNAIPVSDDLALVQVYADSAPQDEATAQLVHRLRDDVVPDTGVDARVGGFNAASVDFAELPRQPVAVPDRRGADPELRPAHARVPFAPRAAQGRHHELALHRRGVRRGRRGVPVGMGREPHRRRSRGTDRGVGADDAVRDRVRPVDGLRGVPALPHEGGVGPHPRERDRRRRRARGDRRVITAAALDHGVRVLGVRARRRPVS